MQAVEPGVHAGGIHLDLHDALDIPDLRRAEFAAVGVLQGGGEAGRRRLRGLGARGGAGTHGLGAAVGCGLPGAAGEPGCRGGRFRAAVRTRAQGEHAAQAQQGRRRAYQGGLAGSVLKHGVPSPRAAAADW
ncbi:hypothetical protein ACFFX0_09670 [Citricoccus parietis]|uniref:Uncharacterized protein n=1 Tax=Citricoccus parietis TaxID=592307 RepID=A0ABV5FXN9_9MICC